MARRVQQSFPFRIVFVVLVLAALGVAVSLPAAETDPPLFAGSNRLSADVRLDEGTVSVAGAGVDGALLNRFYRSRDSALAWSGTAKADREAALALDALRHADEEGLDPSRYHLAFLSRPEAVNDASTFDVLMTDGVLRYMRDLSTGRIAPDAAYRDVSLPPKSLDSVPLLATALSTGMLETMLAGLPPRHPEYAALKAALAQYRRLAAEGEWPQLPKADVKPGEPDPRLALLRARLMREDSALESYASDDEIIAALRRYQSRNGLEADGILGPRSLEMLNIAPAERIAQIEANMDRWRWMPSTLEQRYVMVNVADASLKVVENGAVVLRSKVVVGAPDKRTPILRTQAKEVTVNPPWNVPASIARNEILPKLKRNPNYLVSQHMILVNGPPGDLQGAHVDWAHMSAANLTYRIRQLPGADNALGKLKLEMPSAFGVYLHDTPVKSAFARVERTLSHGCIRVQEILPLASIALSGDTVNAIGELTQLMDTGETRHIALSGPLPVYVVYWTAMVDEGGTVEFRKDVYGRDKTLNAALSLAR